MKQSIMKLLYKICMMKWFKKLMLFFRLLIVAIQLKKLRKKIDHNHDKYITTQELNKLAKENCAAILKKAKLATNADIADFVKKTDFDDKLKKKIISK